jgi:LSD1 subclass zinc finger protein
VRAVSEPAADPTVAAVSPPSLEILRCPHCSGAVPLGDGDTVPCPFCSTVVTVPPAHRALRDAERRDAATRTDAARMYQKLAAPPNPFFKLLGLKGVSLGLVLLSPLILFGTMLVAFHLLAWLEHALHQSFEDLHSTKWYDVLFAATVTVVLAVVALAGSLGRRRARGRMILGDALAARPPERPGGPALCRACGAPLDVPAGALGVRCAYCRADNLIFGDRRGADDDQRKLRRALAFADRERRSDRNRVVLSVILRLALVSVALFAIWIEPMRAAGSLHERTAWDDAIDQPQAHDLEVGATCEGRVHRFALRYRERLHGARPAGGGPLTVAISSHQHTGHLTTDGEPVRELAPPWPPDHAYDFAAPHSGWFYVCVTGTSAPVSFTVVR